MLKSIICILAVLIYTCTACSPLPIVKEEASEYILINQGEQAKIKWKFSNADKVIIQGEQGEYHSIDSTFVYPNSTSSYLITAFNSKSDSLVSLCKVLVIDETNLNSSSTQEVQQERLVQRGPLKVHQQELEISKKYNKYLSGQIFATKLTEPKELRIIKNVYNSADNSITLKSILLDEYGNFVSGYNEKDNLGKWFIDAKCSNVTHSPVFSYQKENNLTKNFKVDIGILLDNSAAQFAGNEVLNNIREYMQFLSPDCNLMFSTFNQKYTQMFALSPAEKALWELQNLELSKPTGLNSLYKSAYLTLDLMNNGFHENKICIIITYISDNSSIIYTANDVHNISKKLGIPVYIVGIGEAVDSYSLRTLATATGGRFYHLMQDETNKLRNVLTEITLSQENNYEMSMNFNYFKQCYDIEAKLNFNINNINLIEKFEIQQNPEFPGLKYQSLVNFDYREVYISNDFHEVLNSLVFVMKNNPEQSVLLVGHSSTEGSELENSKLSYQRAYKVKDFLISAGIPGNRIEIRGEGYHKPIYFFQNNDWEQRYNRRVEIKWLDPTVKPYEIIAELMPSEEQAIKAVDFWENKGYKAYYDRYIINNSPQYQIKLWNFGTKDEANKTASEIMKKFKKNVSVE